jgi:conjugal transfer ATP-binding protein TraC
MMSLGQWGEKIARCLGDKNTYGVEASQKFTDFKKLTEFKPLHLLFPYQTFDSHRKLFINDQSVGFGLEIAPLTGSTEEEVDRIVSLFNDKLPEEGDVHIQLFATNKIDGFLDRFYQARAKVSSVYEALAARRVAYYQKMANRSVSPHVPFYLRDFRVFLYYAEPLKPHFDVQCEALEVLREAWKTTLSSMTWVNELSETVFLHIVREILNPTQSTQWQGTVYRPLDSLSEQVTDSGVSYEINERFIKAAANEECHILQSFNVESLPEKTALWHTGENNGKLLEPSLQLSCPFIVNVHLRAMDKTKSQEKAQGQFMLNDKKAHSPLSRVLPSIYKKHQEWTLLREHLNGNERLVRLSYQITLFSQEETYRKDATRLTDLYRTNGWDLRLDTYLQLPSFLQNCPFMTTAGLFKDLHYFGRLKTMTMFNAVNIMPLMGEWKGTPNGPGLLFVGRRGQLASWSNFANGDGNYNMIVAAKSRAGKSFLMQEIISEVLSSSGIVRVIDLGRSYEKFCHLLGGQYIEMKAGVCINPFTHIVDMQKSFSQVKAIVATMAHPSGNTTDKELAIISNAIQLAWDAKGRAASMTDLVLALEKNNQTEDSVAQDLILLLSKFACEGQYASYFEGPSTIEGANPLIVLELEELKDKPDLKSVVVLSIMLQITEEFYGRPRDIKKLCVIDEAWDLLHSSKHTAEFIEAGYRRVAKQNGAFATIVQSVNDYFRNEMGIAVYENSDNQIILAQLPATIDQLKNNERLKFSPYEEKLLRSFSGTPQFKECLIKTPAGASVFRILFDPFTRILYSTRGEEFEAVRRRMAAGASLSEAIEAVSEEVFSNE